MKILAIRGSTQEFNPSFDASIIEAAYADDPIAAASEYGGNFRSDLQSFVSREVVQACVIPGRFEIPFVKGMRCTFFADPSGGSSDSFTIAGAFNESGISKLAVVRERIPPFSPSDVVAEYSAVIKSYGSAEVVLDRYAGETFVRMFEEQGIRADHSEKNKSEIYVSFLPLLNSGKIELLEVRKLIAQLCALERRSRAGGRDTVDHPPNSHDDLINSGAGALLLASKNASHELFVRNFIESNQSTSYGVRPHSDREDYRANRRSNSLQNFYGGRGEEKLLPRLPENVNCNRRGKS